MNLILTEQECESVEGLLRALRRQGWHVAVHNDFCIKKLMFSNADDQYGTFWLLTNPTTSRFVKGESMAGCIDEVSDLQALLVCCHSIRLLP